MKYILSVIIAISTTIPSISYDDIPLTRDITGTPYRSYEETRSDYNYGAIYHCTEIYASDYKGDKDIILYVNANLYPDIQGKLIGEYVTYLENRNWTVVVKTVSGGNEVQLRNTMKADYDSTGYFHAIFIGDLPIAWFDVDNDSEGEFPCDLFYMDLDGEWRDDVGSDGVFDYHEDGSGDIEADIPMGRWTVSPLAFGGNTEKSLIEHYIDKNLNYRQGGMVHDEGGLAYVDDDWAAWADEWGAAVSCAFDNVVTFSGSYAEEDDYEQVRLPTSYEHMLVCVHSGYYVHTWNGSWSYPTYNTELYNIKSHSITYNMFACSNTRFTEPDYMGGWYTFMDNDWGVLSIGSTKSGSMLNFEEFYQPLGNGATYGEAFQIWFADNAESGAGGDSRGWFYGMSVNGDPTLKIAHYIPVRLGDFTSIPERNGVRLSWVYSDDGEEVGFNLFRRETNSSGSYITGESYEIKLNDQLISGVSPLGYFDDTASYDTEYEYRLEMIVDNTCVEELTTKVQTLTPIKTVFELAKPYPNPGTRIVNFAYNISDSDNSEFVIYDISGRTVYKTDVKTGSGVISWEIDGGNRNKVSNGVYFAELSNGKEVDFEKFIISR